VYFGDIDGTRQRLVDLDHLDEIAFLAGGDNAIEWNTIYNFAFDSTRLRPARPAQIDQARPGPGLDTLQVLTDAPVFIGNINLGGGCGVDHPILRASGSPAIATLPNPTFGLVISGMQPNVGGVLFVSPTEGNLPLAGGACSLRTGFPLFGDLPIQANVGGVWLQPLPLPNDPALEGASLVLQAIEFGTGGPLFGQFRVTNGLRIRFGNLNPACPQ
jgi:hypothetical protein